MPPSLDELLRHRFEELGVDATRSAWADHLDNLDKGTLSRILNGGMPLSQDRANKWAGLLFPDDAAAAQSFAVKLVEAAVEGGQARTIPQFFDSVVERGGFVPVERIAELFLAFERPEIDNALLLIEYRDIPRAGPHAKYQSLAADLGRAIAHGLSVGMFMPFKPRGSTCETRSKAEKFMEEVRDECRTAYRKFKKEASEAIKGRPGCSANEIDERLKLYEPADECPYTLGTGIQAKTFYLQYDSKEGDKTIRHHRILQWVATPTRDLLIYRGELMIGPGALRDSFFPVPHAFDLGLEKETKSLPVLPMDASSLKTLKKAWDGFGLPFDVKLWKLSNAP